MLTKYYPILTKVAKELTRDISALGSTIVVFGLAILLFTVQPSLGLQLIIGLIVIDVVGNLLKLIISKDRPDGEKYHNIIEKIHARSFPSIHSARFLFIALIIFRFTNNLLLGILLGILAILVGISRVTLNRHSILDVAAGYLLALLTYTFL